MAAISLVIAVSSPISTTLTFTPAAPFTGSGTSFSAVGPIAAGVTVGTVSVVPAGWSGVLTLSGQQAASFSIAGLNLVTAAALASGSYGVTITATP